MGLATLGVRPGRDPARGVRRRRLRQRLRRHLAEPVASLLLGPLLVPGERRRLPRAAAPAPRAPMPDGPLIVQSDKTLLLEVDHEQSDECRKAIAPFAELERSPEHVHTYRLTPLGLWNARAAGHDAEQVVDTLLAFSRYAVPHALLVDIAETMARYGRLRLDKHPTHGLVLTSNDLPVLEEVLRAKKIAPMIGARLDESTVVVHPSERGNLKQALLKLGWPAEDYAGYVDGEAHEIALDEIGVDAAELPARGRRLVLARRLGRGGAAVRCRQDAGRCGRDGQGAGDHADPGDQHGGGSPVEGRADPSYDADRRRDRRVQRRRQGGPAGHDRDLPGDDHPAEGRLQPPRAVRRQGLGADRVRRGAPAAGADLPDDRGPAGAAPHRADRDPDPRGRPRGRRVLADRTEALRRAVEGHRGAGLDRPRRLCRGAGDASRERAVRLRDRRARRALPARVVHRRQDPARRGARREAQGASRRW